MTATMTDTDVLQHAPPENPDITTHATTEQMHATIAAETIPSRPTTAQIAEALITQSGCTAEKAQEVIDFLIKARDESRRTRYGLYHLNDLELMSVHPVLDVVMPDDTVAQPGSAHDLANRGMLDAERGELAFVHTKGGPVARNCATKIAVASAP